MKRANYVFVNSVWIVVRRSLLTKVFSFLCLMFLVVLLACKDYPTETIQDWTPLGKFPGLARASATSFVVGDKAYVCLGRSNARNGFLKDLWEYNSQTDTWLRKTDFPGKARVKAVAGVVGTKAYIGMGAVGAYGGDNLFSDFWEYDTQTDVWTQKKSFPGQGKNDLYCVVVNGIIYTGLGYDGIHRRKEAWKYDPIEDTWTSLPNCPFEASNTAGFVLENSFYVGSGFRGCNLDYLFRYQPDVQKWTRMSDMPNARMLSNGIAIGNIGYILLGRYWNGSLNGGRLLSDIVSYNPTDNSWTKRGHFPGGARQNSVVFSIGSEGYVVMGEDDVERKSDVWKFKP